MRLRRIVYFSVTITALLILPGVLLPVCALPQTTTPITSAVRALLEQADTAAGAAKQDDATNLYAQARKAARADKDRIGEAAALIGLGRMARLAKHLPEAQVYFESALSIYQATGDAAGQAQSLFLLGKVSADGRQSLQAVAHYTAAASLFLSVGKKQEAAVCLLQTASLVRLDGQSQKAMTYCEQALPLFQDVPDKDGVMKTQLLWGACYGDLQDTVHALEHLEPALLAAKELGDEKRTLMVMNNIAVVRTARGELRQALEILTSSLPQQEALGDWKSLITTLDNIALLDFRTGDVLNALQSAQRALDTARKTNDWHNIATSLEVLGGLCYNLSRFDDALQYCREAEAAARKTNDLRVQARNLNSLANVYEQLKRGKEERAALLQSLEIYRKTGDTDGEASALYSLSTCLILSGETAQAKTCAEQARTKFHAAGDAEGEGMVRLMEGEILEKQERYGEAMPWYQEALALFQGSDAYLGQAETWTRMAECKSAAGHPAEAEAFYVQALAIQERFRAGMGDLTRTKLRYNETLTTTYRSIIGLLLRTGQNERAFDWAQKAKSRVLIDLMQAPIPAPALSPDAQKQQAALQRRGNALTRQWLASLNDLSDMRRQARPDANRRRTVETQAQEIEQRRQQLEQEWDAWQERQALHTSRDLPQPARTVTLADTAVFLPPDTALLEYVTVQTGQGKKARIGFVLFVVTQGSGKPRLRVMPIKADAATLAQKTEQLRLACAARPGSAAEMPYRPLARELYALLIAPAESALQGIHRLVICPDGPLWNAPFQAMLAAPPAVSGTGSLPPPQFLWERYALVYACSATETQAALALHNRPRRVPPQNNLLVVANPDFGANSSTAAARDRTTQTETNASRDLFLRGGALRALPYTQAEANAIRTAFPDAVVKTGSDAQESFVKQSAAGYRYLHFATHAIFNDTAPLLSGVALSRPPKNSAEDGILTAREIFDMRLSADMVVFSACETARGTAQPGEGIIGLTWAAFAAGVPAQVVSQWSVDDAATAKLMGAFYGGLKQSQSKDAALRSAALTLLRDGRYTHPFYWAPFIVMGDWH